MHITSPKLPSAERTTSSAAAPAPQAKAKKAASAGLALLKFAVHLPLAGVYLAAGASMSHTSPMAGLLLPGVVLGFTAGALAAPFVALFGVGQLLKAGGHLLASPVAAAVGGAHHGARVLLPGKD